MEQPEPIKGSSEPKPEHALELLDEDDVERLLAEVEDDEDEEEEK